eukprot:jgi/Chlat1/5733/Chrsp38S05529
MPAAEAAVSALDIPASASAEISRLQSQDRAEAARAAAAVLLLASRPEAAAALPNAVGPLTTLLSSDHEAAQRNACAALAGIANAGYVKEILRANVLPVVLSFLFSESHEEQLKVNAAAVVRAISDSEAGAQAAISADVVSALADAVQQAVSAVLYEALADAACALCAVESIRTALVRQGLVRALASLLLRSDEQEVLVRVLLALAMLTGSSADAQAQLAAEDGAVQRLMTLVRSADGDVREIAAGVFMSLAANPTLRPAIVELQQQPQAVSQQ